MTKYFINFILTLIFTFTFISPAFAVETTNPGFRLNVNYSSTQTVLSGVASPAALYDIQSINPTWSEADYLIGSGSLQLNQTFPVSSGEYIIAQGQTTTPFTDIKWSGSSVCGTSVNFQVGKNSSAFYILIQNTSTVALPIAYIIKGTNPIYATKVLSNMETLTIPSNNFNSQMRGVLGTNGSCGYFQVNGQVLN